MYNIVIFLIFTPFSDDRIGEYPDGSTEQSGANPGAADVIGGMHKSQFALLFRRSFKGLCSDSTVQGFRGRLGSSKSSISRSFTIYNVRCSIVDSIIPQRLNGYNPMAIFLMDFEIPKQYSRNLWKQAWVARGESFKDEAVRLPLSQSKAQSSSRPRNHCQMKPHTFLK